MAGEHDHAARSYRYGLTSRTIASGCTRARPEKKRALGGVDQGMRGQNPTEVRKRVILLGFELYRLRWSEVSNERTNPELLSLA
jgi:hypothetical protein